jgi:uncharacterized protein (DUF488 family)
MRRASWRVYKRLYRAALARLDPHTVWDELNALADGAEPILLCWESHEESDYCHRRLVAEWFKRTLGKQVSELKLRN